MKILVICDDYYHPGQVVVDGLKPLEKQGFHFDVIMDGAEVHPAHFGNYHCIILSKMDERTAEDQTSWLSKDIQHSLMDYVKHGGGLLMLHSGIVEGVDTEEFHRFIGCRFVHHPKPTSLLVQPLKHHAITAGVDVFQEEDEQYYIEILRDDVNILCASYAQGQGDPSKIEEDGWNNSIEKICCSGYVLLEGNGRICMLAPGHFQAVFHNPEYQKTITNALKWLSAENVTS